MSEGAQVAEPVEEYKSITRWFVVFMVRTRRGLGLMETLGRTRITKPLAWFMLFLMPIGGAIALYYIFQLVFVYFSPQATAYVSYVRTISPLANFLLPGINPYLPLSVWLAVIVAVVIHEAAHGIVARSLGFPIKSAGVLLLLFLPIGAFVEVDDKHLKESRSRDSLRVLGAGAGINFIVGLVCIVLLIVSVGMMVPTGKGAAILQVPPDTPQQHSPAYLAGLQPGDYITAINNHPVTDIGWIKNGSLSPGQSINLTILRGGHSMNVPVTLASTTVTTINTANNTSQTTVYPFLGVEQASYQDLQGITSRYTNIYKQNPLIYLSLIPTFQRTETIVPFSDLLSVAYTSPLGSLTQVVNGTLYWLFFVNFSLAIFNALPIYPLDGGQAFETFLKGAGKGKISEALAKRVTTGLTMAIFLALFVVIAGPYITGVFAPT